MYRLVVQRRGRDGHHDALVFDDYKRAVSQVATAVRRHGEPDTPDTVSLQRGTPTAEHAGSESLRWTEVERWGPDVVNRILEQDRAWTERLSHLCAKSKPLQKQTAKRVAEPRPQLSDKTRPYTDSPQQQTDSAAATVGPATDPDTPAPQPAASAHLLHLERLSKRWYRNSGWYLAITAAIVALTWIVLLLFMTGGRPDLMLRDHFAAQKAEAAPADIGFDGTLLKANGSDCRHNGLGAAGRQADRNPAHSE